MAWGDGGVDGGLEGVDGGSREDLKAPTETSEAGLTVDLRTLMVTSLAGRVVLRRKMAGSTMDFRA